MRSRLLISSATAAVLLMAVPAVATAGAPSWSKPQLLAAGAGAGDVAVDGSGEILAVWASAGGGGVFLASRPPNARRFGAPQRLEAGRASGPKVAANEAGGAIVLWSHEEGATCNDLACQATLRVRLRGPGGRFRQAQQLPASQGISYSDAVTAGDEAIVAWDTRGGGLRVARGPLTGQISAPQVLAGGADTYDAPFSLAANARGDAVIAWTSGRPEATGLRVMASFRPARGSFGPPVVVFQGTPATESDPTVSAAVDARGRANVMLSTTVGQTSLARRSGGGAWRIEAVGAGLSPRLASNAEGDLMAWWYRMVPQPGAFPRYETDVLLAAPGKPFGAQRRLPVGDGAPVLGGFDSRANALVVSAGPQPGQHLVAGTLSRFGLSEIQDLNAQPSQPIELAVNGAGAAAALSYVFRPDGGTDLVVIDRRADTSVPALRVLSGSATPAVLTADVRCDEACRVRVDAGAGKPRAGGGKPRAGAAKRRAAPTQLVRPGRRTRVRIAVPARRSTALRRALRGGRRVRLPLAIQAEDAAGNRRVVRRKVIVRGGR